MNEQPGVPRERFDARYPLLRVWSLGMGLPTLKSDGSRDAFMIAREGQVWECARNSSVHVVRFPPTIVEPITAAAVVQTDSSMSLVTIDASND